jgi:hypothetical protein
VLLYVVFHSVAEALVLIFPTTYALSGGLILQWALGYNFNAAVWVGYNALFGIVIIPPTIGAAMGFITSKPIPPSARNGARLASTAALVEADALRLQSPRRGISAFVIGDALAIFCCSASWR